MKARPPVGPLYGSKRKFCSRRFGSHGQQRLLTVGFPPRCTKLPTTTANCAVIVAPNAVREGGAQ